MRFKLVPMWLAIASECCYLHPFFYYFFIVAECLSICMSVMLLAPARVQDGVPTSYTDTNFALLAHEGSEIWISQSLHFTKVGLLQLQHDWSLCSLCFSRDLTTGDGPMVPWWIKQYEREFQAAKPGLSVSATAGLSVSAIYSWSLELSCKQRNPSTEGLVVLS